MAISDEALVFLLRVAHPFLECPAAAGLHCFVTEELPQSSTPRWAVRPGWRSGPEPTRRSPISHEMTSSPLPYDHVRRPPPIWGSIFKALHFLPLSLQCSVFFFVCLFLANELSSILSSKWQNTIAIHLQSLAQNTSWIGRLFYWASNDNILDKNSSIICRHEIKQLWNGWFRLQVGSNYTHTKKRIVLCFSTIFNAVIQTRPLWLACTSSQSSPCCEPVILAPWFWTWAAQFQHKAKEETKERSISLIPFSEEFEEWKMWSAKFAQIPSTSCKVLVTTDHELGCWNATNLFVLFQSLC